jgi:2-polyprenyl-3-methyl-5-hydroxy-6-metoxy-1,4-benzoquinol methylase
MKCYICGSEKSFAKFNVGSSQLFGCRDCKGEFLSPQPSDLILRDLYSSDYYRSWGISDNPKNNEVATMKKLTGRRQLKNIANYQNGGKILDVGCALGYFLELAAESNYIPYGVELSEFSSSIAKKKFGKQSIFNGELEKCDFPLNEFNVITMFDLLEHAREPLQVLLKAKQLLKQEGIISITTPDVLSPLRFIMRKRWIHYKPEHLFYFSKQSLTILAEKADLKIGEMHACSKVFTLDYAIHQFEVYRHFLLTPLASFLKFIVPAGLRKHPFYFKIGEMNVILVNK